MASGTAEWFLTAVYFIVANQVATLSETTLTMVTGVRPLPYTVHDTIAR